MKKIDYKKELKHLYKPSPKRVEVVDVPEMNFLMIDGQGDPNTAKDYSDAIEALYTVSYSLKFMIKKGELEIDYGVMPLEGCGGLAICLNLTSTTRPNGNGHL